MGGVVEVRFLGSKQQNLGGLQMESILMSNGVRDGRQLTKVFKALSDGTRQEILRLLEGNQRTVGEIVGNFKLSQPTISRHLSVLKEADLVVDQRQGQNVIYRLNNDTLSDSMRDFFGQFRSCQQALR
jgi:ArsR family transcriptional regulator, arsenate/arsenite/antimonite-responsive transcriptional repressor